MFVCLFRIVLRSKQYAFVLNIGIALRGLVGKPEGKKPLGRPRCRWEENIEMGDREVGWEGMDWIDLVQNGGRWWAVVKAVMYLRVP
jgi:hypothetical protein